MVVVVWAIVQNFIEQNVQQARQILVEDPLLNKALFQVARVSFFVAFDDVGGIFL